MDPKKTTIGLTTGTPDALTKEICQALAENGVTAIVRRTPTAEARAEEQIRHLVAASDPKDVFFNGWTLLF
jgi:NAD(P)-dependent dehydrogenase (short-subunit alcohol dehydrogenase family)